MKKRYVKLFGVPYYVKEQKRFPWSRWEPVRNYAGEYIPFRRVGEHYEPEWKWSKPDEPVTETQK